MLYCSTLLQVHLATNFIRSVYGSLSATVPQIQAFNSWFMTLHIAWQWSIILLAFSFLRMLLRLLYGWWRRLRTWSKQPTFLYQVTNFLLSQPEYENLISSLNKQLMQVNIQTRKRTPYEHFQDIYSRWPPHMPIPKQSKVVRCRQLSVTHVATYQGLGRGADCVCVTIDGETSPLVETNLLIEHLLSRGGRQRPGGPAIDAYHMEGILPVLLGNPWVVLATMLSLRDHRQYLANSSGKKPMPLSVSSNWAEEYEAILSPKSAA